MMMELEFFSVKSLRQEAFLASFPHTPLQSASCLRILNLLEVAVFDLTSHRRPAKTQPADDKRYSASQIYTPIHFTSTILLWWLFPLPDVLTDSLAFGGRSLKTGSNCAVKKDQADGTKTKPADIWRHKVNKRHQLLGCSGTQCRGCLKPEVLLQDGKVEPERHDPSISNNS